MTVPGIPASLFIVTMAVAECVLSDTRPTRFFREVNKRKKISQKRQGLRRDIWFSPRFNPGLAMVRTSLGVEQLGFL